MKRAGRGCCQHENIPWQAQLGGCIKGPWQEVMTPGILVRMRKRLELEKALPSKF